jgi:drug/metabolite transporter (DMT)-like permease
MTKNRYFGWLMAIVAVILFSSKAILVKLMYQYPNTDAIGMTALRMFFAFPIFACVAYYTRRSLSFKQILYICLAGFLGYYLASFLDFLALKYISTSLERLILFLNPGLVVLLSWVFFRHKINRWQLFSLLIAYVSVWVVFSHEQMGGKNIYLGIILAFASTFSYSLYLILCSHLIKEVGSIRLTALASCVACFLCLGQFFLLKPNTWQYLSTLHTNIYWLSLINGILCTVIPVFLTMLAIERCGPSVTSQTSMIGPLITAFLGIWILQEAFTIYHVIGTGGVLISMLFLSKSMSRIAS